MNNNNNVGKMEEIPKGTALNPEYVMTSAFHSNFILQDDSVYAGESVDEHTSIENANEYLAKKELGQINNNS